MLFSAVAFTDAPTTEIFSVVTSISGVTTAVIGDSTPGGDAPGVFGGAEVEILIDADTTDATAFRLALFDAIATTGGILARFA